MNRPLRPTAGWVYLAAFVSVGLSLTILGPALTYLRHRAGVDEGDIAILFPASSIGYLLGSLASGWWYDHGGGHKAMAAGLLGLGAAELLVPHVTGVGGLALVFALVGAFAGCIDVGGNTFVVWHTRGSGSQRLINALHLFFGIGALVSPVLVDRSLVWADSLSVAVGFIAVYSAAVAVVLWRHQAPVHTEHHARAEGPQTPARILLVIAFFFVLYVGIEIGFSGWIKTYAEGIELPGRNSPTWINTLFFVCFTVGRLLAVTLSKYVKAGPMLVGSCALTSLFLLVMALADGSPPFVWACTAVIGITIAPQFATMIAYAEEHIALTGRATGWFISAAGVGGLILPWLIGQLLEDSTGAMPITVLCGAVAATAWFAVARRTLINHRGVPSELIREPA